MPDKTTASDEVEVSLKGGGLTFSRKITVETALKIMALSVGAPVQTNAEVPPVDLTPNNVNGDGNGDGKGDSGSQGRTDLGLSVGEFMDKHNAQRNVDKIAAIAQFMKEGGEERFTTDDIKSEFPKAGEKVPGNFARDFRWAKTAKWIAMDNNDKKLHYITNTGTKAVKASFPADVKKASKVKVGTKKTSKASGSKP